MSMSADQINATPVLLRHDDDGIVTLTLKSAEAMQRALRRSVNCAAIFTGRHRPE